MTLQQIHSLTRLQLIDWLITNDRNGVYSDKDSLQEFGSIISLDEAREIVTRQIKDNTGDLL